MHIEKNKKRKSFRFYSQYGTRTRSEYTEKQRKSEKYHKSEVK